MPSKNVVKDFAPDSYYHVYNRGVAKQAIFLDSLDKKQFVKIINRHLDPSNKTMKIDGMVYRKFCGELEILCYCLMGNHLHLLFYQADNIKAMTDFMRAISTAYTMYFNRRYKRVGPLFQGIYKASRVSDDKYLLHISRYIHLNPRGYKTYKYSSYLQYLGKPSPVWLKPAKILDLFEGDEYAAYVADHADYQNVQDDLKYKMADKSVPITKNNRK